METTKATTTTTPASTTTTTEKPLMRIVRSKLKQATLLWLEGFREACCIHRVFILCYRSRPLLIRTGQCFLLNGFIFLGSLFFVNSVVIPTLEWILPDVCSQITSHEHCSFGAVLKLNSFLRHGLIQLFYILWFYPLCIFSLILSNIWYNDIAKHGFVALGRAQLTVAEPSSQEEVPHSSANMEKHAGLGGVMIGIGEQIYSILLLGFFFLEVYATGYVPYIGKALKFLLISWMYAYYCFEYKWNLSEVVLDKRLDFFETNWAFFAGFGNPCVLAIFFFSPLVSSGVMAILFPLFVLTATGSEAEQVISFQTRKWRDAGLGRLPIFYVANTLAMVSDALLMPENLSKLGAFGKAKQQPLSGIMCMSNAGLMKDLYVLQSDRDITEGDIFDGLESSVDKVN